MIFQGFCLPLRSRFALFFVGMAFLGAVSAPLYAADSPAPSAWDRLFGSKPKTTESDPKEQKPKKAKTQKETQKKQKSSTTKKSGKETKAQAAAAAAAALGAQQSSSAQAAAEVAEPSPAPALPLAETTEASSLKTETAPNQIDAAAEGSSVPFWKRLFSGASSSPTQEAVTQSNLPPASPPPADVATSAAPTPPANPAAEPSNTEPFWKRIFGGASSSPPQEAVTQSNLPPASQPPADVTTTAAPTTPVNPTAEGSSVPFWKRLFGGASSSPAQEAATQSNLPPASPPPADVATSAAPTPLANEVNPTTEGSSVPFWKRLFSGASSSPAQEAVTQSNVPVPSQGPASPPPADVSTSAAPTPLANEPSSTEPFWKRIFGGGSSAPPQKAVTQSNVPPASPPPADVTTTAAPTTPSVNPAADGSSVPFWKRLFSGASSSPTQEAVTQSNLPPASPPPADVATSAAPTPPANPAAEPSNTEPFWRRIFGGASSKQPDSTPEQVSVTEPLKEATPTPATASSKSSGVEEPSLWQKLFGSKPSDKKVAPNETPLIQKPVERGAATPTPSPAIPSASTALSLPSAVAPSPSTTDTKSSFSLANVCEREKCELMVLFDGPINKSNVDKFIQSTSSVPAGTAVLLNSTDGDLNSGIRLGQILRQKNFNTRVGRTQLNKKILNEIDGQCYSSCVLAFAGGVNRRIDSNDKIGVYALRSSTKTVNENEMRTAVNNLGIYFEQMGVDRRLVDQMLEAKGSAVSPISLSSAKALNLDNGTRISTFPWRMQALDNGLLIILVTEKQASNHFSITLGLTKQNKDKDYRLTVFAKPLTGNPNLNQLADYLNRESRLQIAFSNQTIAPSPIKRWEATSSGIQTAILLTDKELTTMSSALEFEFDLLQIQNNPYKLDSGTIFGTSGLKGALRAIK